MSLQKYSHDFFELADECGCPGTQINALTRAVVTYSNDIKLTQEAAAELNKYNIEAVPGQKLTRVIGRWAKNVNFELREHPQFNRRFAKLCDALTIAGTERKDTAEYTLITKSKPKNKRHKKIRNTARSLDAGGHGTKCYIRDIQYAINRYNSIVGLAGRETNNAKKCLNNIFDLCNQLARYRLRLELGKLSIDKQWTLQDVKKAFLKERVYFYSGDSSDIAPQQVDFAIFMSTNSKTHPIYAWDAHWVDTHLRVNGYMLTEWGQEKSQLLKQ